MSSLVADRGVQLPSVESVPVSSLSDGDDALFLSSRYGLTADPWQEIVIRAWLGRKPGGRWSAPRCGLAVPRQNGKNAVIEIRELFGVVFLAERFLHTAHEVKTARKAFVRLCSFFENEREYPELSELVKDIRRTNGQEAIVLHNGGSVEFIARSKSSGRGFTADVLVMDEAQEASEEALAALLPTVSASANPQMILTGIPPGPTANGEVFTRTRTAGVEGSDGRLCWHEWSCQPGADLDDRGEWRRANPNLEVRLQVDTIADERATMDDDTFARERLGVWDVDRDSHPTEIDMQTWAELAVDAAPTGDVGYGVKFSPDGKRVSLAVAVRHDGGVHVEGVEHRMVVDGTQWLVEWLKARHGTAVGIVVDGRSGSGAFVQSLDRAGVRRGVVEATAQQAIAAHSTFLTAIAEGTLSHVDDPMLEAAVGVAGRRLIGTAGGFGFQSIDDDTDITLLEAAVMAHHAATSMKRKNGPSKVVVLQ